MCPAVRSIRPEYGHLLLEVRHLELKKYNRSSIKGDENHNIYLLSTIAGEIQPLLDKRGRDPTVVFLLNSLVINTTAPR